MRARPAPAGSQGVRSGGIGIFLVLGSVTLLGPAAVDSYFPALPALSADLGGSASATQLTVTSFLVGLALGQAAAGPLSDVHGRRRPLLVGMAAFTLASLLCAFAPNIWALTALRLVQGMTASGGITISRAIVRDMFAGEAAARYLSRLILVTGLAPILAPLVGAQILRVGSWRHIFVATALLGLVLVLTTARLLPETHPPEHRRASGVRATAGSYRSLLRDRRFVGLTLVLGLAFGAIIAYAAGSPFVVQTVYGASAQTFSLIFAGCAVVMIVSAQVNAHLLRRTTARRLMRLGLALNLASGMTVLVVVVALPETGVLSLLPGFVLVAASWGFLPTNAAALALTEHPKVAGAAAAVLGLSQYIFGAVAAPLAGAGGNDTAVPMALVMVASAVAAILAARFLASSEPARPRRARLAA